ncbi:MAG: branched-chain amino acid ABC transporter permease [Alphaproteobacteria bacterium]|nr:branched-chain amino acid ABC transporter permease [Alphaproteobacteria bacterium]
MESVIQVIVSGLLLGAMYAVSAVGLSLIWGALGMLNMAHGSLLTIGAYLCYSAIVQAGLPNGLGLPIAMIASGLLGLVIYFAVVHWMYRRQGFETNIILATIGLAMVFENVVLKIYGAYPVAQPFGVDRSQGFQISTVFVPWQNFVIIAVSAALMIAIALILRATRMGRAIRATAQSREAALLMGVPVGLVFAQVMALGGVVAAVSGVMISSITTLAPPMGYDPMMKAFIVCVVGGLGNVPGAFIAAFLLGLIEAIVQFGAGTRFGYPALLVLVIIALLWRPYGVFGRRVVTRV